MPLPHKLRSATGFSGRSAKSDKSLPTRRTFPFSQTPPQPDKKPARKPATYAVYELEWENLKKFLLGKWPGHKFERRVVGDNYVFDTPESLTSIDKLAIGKLVGAPADGGGSPSRLQSESPEPF